MARPKPTVFITAGDPLGIGPEVAVRALQNPQVHADCTPILIGEPHSLTAAGYTPDLAPLIPLESLLPKPAARYHGPSAWGGEISFRAVQLACKLAERKRGARVVTAPISKQSWALAGVPFTGHTEFLRKCYGTHALMMFAAGPIRAALASEHFSIADLPHILTRTRIIRTGRDFQATLQRMGIKNPRLALSAFNPHGGDNGQFGTEEKRILTPALRKLQAEKVQIEGPYPIDSLWVRHRDGEFDGILCLYHDQALLGLKLTAREPIVHITSGLSILRTSPTHGTAFDIAGKSKSNPAGMLAAILFAARQNSTL